MVWLVLFCFGLLFFMYAFSRGYRCALDDELHFLSQHSAGLTQRQWACRFLKWFF